MRAAETFPITHSPLGRLPNAGFYHLIRPPASDVLSDFLLGYVGGFADTTGFLMAGSFTGHITGNLVLLMTSVATGRYQSMYRPLVAIGVFLAATVVGQIVKRANRTQLRWGMLLFQCCLICALELSAVRSSLWFATALVVVFATCLGLQNGYTGSTDGVTVHLSYMTGTATRWINAIIGFRHTDDAERTRAALVVSSSVLLGFASGALSAAFAQRVSAYYAPSLLCVPLILAALFSDSYEM